MTEPGTTVWLTRRSTLVLLPLSMIVWVNVHGSFPMGIALVGLALVGEALARMFELPDG